MNLLLAPGVDLASGTKAIAVVPGVERVRQVFPDQTDQELKRMFVLDVTPRLSDAALVALREASFVEEVELVSPKRAKSR